MSVSRISDQPASLGHVIRVFGGMAGSAVLGLMLLRAILGH